jgi:2-iminobutanoate/2-iminopropanoate deaminase
MANTAKSIVQLPGMAQPKGVWSTAVVAKPGQLIFVSGLLAKDDTGKIIDGDITAQTDKVCQNLIQALSGAGAKLEDIVRVDVYVRDISKFAEIHAVRRKYFVKDPPASTMVEISRFTEDKALIEINAIAVIP